MVIKWTHDSNKPTQNIEIIILTVQGRPSSRAMTFVFTIFDNSMVFLTKVHAYQNKET